MDTASSALSIAGVREVISEPPAIENVPKEGPKPSQVQPSAPEVSAAADAVLLKLSSPVASENKPVDSNSGASAIKNPVAQAQADEELSEAGAQKIAENLEKTLNSITGTEVRFKVSFEKDEQKSSFMFQVVDKETGRVVRQFPPNQINEVKNRAAQKLGLLVDGSA